MFSMYSKKKKTANKMMIDHEKMLKMVPLMQEEHKKRVESLQFRHNLLQTQKRNNYINEYERLNGYLNTHIVPPLQTEIKDKSNSRMKELTNQVNKSFISSPNPSLYNKHVYNKMWIKQII